jgi:hypothetical protein
MGSTRVEYGRIQGLILINQLLNQALGEWGNIHPHKGKPPTLDFLIQSRDHIIVFWFEITRKAKNPVLISKIPRTRQFNHYIERSVELVDSLRRILKPPITETIPFRVFAGRVNDLSHIVMGVLPGEPIYMPADNFLGRRAVERHLSAFLSWLVEFQSQSTTGNRAYDNSDWENFFEQRRINTFNDFPKDDQYQRSSKGVSDKLSAVTIPCSWGYGDAHHSNILTEGDQVSGVVDWLGVQESQWVHIDWYYFLFFYAMEFFKKNQNIDLAAQRRLAISTIMGINAHWLSGLFQGKTRQFLEHNSIEPHLNPEFFFTFLHNLYWPKDKDRLIKDAYTIYNQITR